jgi:hypothetical protein
MTQMKTLALIGCLFAGVVAWNLLSPLMNACAQAFKVGQKWEYAVLFYHDDRDFGSYATWTTGKKNLGAQRKKEEEPPPFSKLFKDLGGKEKGGSKAELLDLIGQDGWELVSYTRTEEARSRTETWTFKRPVA